MFRTRWHKTVSLAQTAQCRLNAKTAEYRTASPPCHARHNEYWDRNLPIRATTNVSNVRTNVSYVRTNVSYVRTTVSYMRTNVSYVHTNISYVRTKVSYVRTKVSYVRTNDSYVRRCLYVPPLIA
eukprot:4911082-Pleurochrysis_carterae.AAC.1